MPSSILVDLTTTNASGNAPGSWGDISGMYDTIDVKDTDSVCILLMSIQLNDGTDHTAEFQFAVILICELSFFRFTHCSNRIVIKVVKERDLLLFLSSLS